MNYPPSNQPFGGQPPPNYPSPMRSRWYRWTSTNADAVGYRKAWGKTPRGALIGCSALIVCVLLLCGICGAISNASSKGRPVATQVTEAPKPTEPFKVDVTSLNVKQVSGKYRYYFQVMNHDTKPFIGSATIELYNDKQATPLGKETFDTTNAIEPTFGTMVYFDINSGPPVVAGPYGVTHFKFTIKVNNQEVNSGEGQITDLSGA